MKLQNIKRDTLRQIVGTVDYTVELSCGHPIRITKKQLHRPGRVQCHLCPDDAVHAKTPPKGPLKAILQGPYNDPREGPILYLECGHSVPSKTMYAERLPKRMRCAKCLEAQRSTPG